MIGVFFGGVSCEHEVSVLTGLTMFGFLEGQKRAVYLDREGRWWSGKGPQSLEWFRAGRPERAAEEVVLLPGSPTLYRKKGSRLKPLCELSCALVCCHGRQGEDGCLQGLFELCGIPYTSAGVAASAVGMDKALTKQLLAGRIPQLPFEVLEKEAFRQGKLPANRFPLIVKPARGGSSVGVGVAKDEAGLMSALTEAFRYDEKAVIEPWLTDFEEYNCSAFACGGRVMVSGLERPLRSREILTYADKYQKGNYKAGKGGAGADPGLTRKIREMTAEVYRLLELSGVVRADFLVRGGEVCFNEVNTVPGSLAFYFWEKEGIPPNRLLSLLTGEARERAAEKKELCSRFPTDILRTAGLNSCKK